MIWTFIFILIYIIGVVISYKAGKYITTNEDIPWTWNFVILVGLLSLCSWPILLLWGFVYLMDNANGTPPKWL